MKRPENNIRRLQFLLRIRFIPPTAFIFSLDPDCALKRRHARPVACPHACLNFIIPLVHPRVWNEIGIGHLDGTFDQAVACPLTVLPYLQYVRPVVKIFFETRSYRSVQERGKLEGSMRIDVGGEMTFEKDGKIPTVGKPEWSMSIIIYRAFGVRPSTNSKDEVWKRELLIINWWVWYQVQGINDQ